MLDVDGSKRISTSCSDNAKGFKGMLKKRLTEAASVVIFSTYLDHGIHGILGWFGNSGEVGQF